MKARKLLGMTVLIFALASWSTYASAQVLTSTSGYGTFWNGSVSTQNDDPGDDSTCCPSYTVTSQSAFASHSLNGVGVWVEPGEPLLQSDSNVTIDGSAALESAIDVTSNAYAEEPGGLGNGTLSLGWFDTIEVVSSALPAGTPVNFRGTLSLNVKDELSFMSFAAQQVEVSWIPLNDEPSVAFISIVADGTGCDCTQSRTLTQDSPVTLVVGGEYQVIVTVQLTFAGVPFANIEDGVAAVSDSSAFALTSLSSGASFRTASGLGEPPGTDRPAIAINSPTKTTYTLNENVQSEYSCSDPDDTVQICAGQVPSGLDIDTASVGGKTFTVQATDEDYNSSSETVDYDVAYNICPLYDTSRSARSGSTIPIKIQLCDANDTDRSNSGVVVHATSVVMLPENISEPLQNTEKSNSANAFRFDSKLGPSGGYIFKLKTRHYAPGAYALRFTAGSDPTVHSLPFFVKMNRRRQARISP